MSIQGKDLKLQIFPRFSDEDGESEYDEETGIAVAPQRKVKRPKRFKVIMHNDDYTTMEFVVDVLRTVFHKELEEAKRIMLDIHQKGNGVCGVYTFEIAESKAEKVTRMAREEGHPLKCSIEEE